jgi:Ran GTPase-activating protein (RanGAP) involved in mRNA processing and transport
VHKKFRKIHKKILKLTQEKHIADGFLVKYDAYCNYFKTPIRREVHRFIEALVEKNDHDLDLTNCPGIDSKSEIAININTVILPLMYNSYFRGIELRNVPHRELTVVLGQMLNKNTTIAKIVLQGIDAVDVSNLGLALSKNKENKVEILDLSNNSVDRGFISIAASLISQQHGVRILNFENCNLSAKSTTALFEALAKNYAMSLSIRELYVGGNKFDEFSMNAMCHWLDQSKGYLALRKISLANTVVDLNRTLKLLLFNVHMEYFDFSGIKIVDETIAGIFADLINASYELKTLKLSTCHLTIKTIETIVSAIMKNKKLNKVHLDLSGNEIGPAGALQLVKTMKEPTCFSTINFADCKLKAKGVSALIDIMTDSLETLILDENISHDEIESMCKRLADLAGKFALKRLSIAGGKTSFKKFLNPFFSYLQFSDNLLELDCSANVLGDLGAVALSEMLFENSSIVSLIIDGNHFTLSGYQTLLNALRHNKSVFNIPYPFKDIERLDSRQKIEVIQIWLQIQTILNKNKSKNNLERVGDFVVANQPVKSPTTPDGLNILYTPLASLPQHLKQVYMPTLEEQLLGRIDLNQLGKGTSLSADFAVQKSHSSAALSPRSLSADNSENRDSARESSSLPSLTKSLGVDSPKKAKSPRSKSRKKITIDTEKIDGTKKEVRIDSPRKEVKIDSPRKEKEVKIESPRKESNDTPKNSKSDNKLDSPRTNAKTDSPRNSKSDTKTDSPRKENGDANNSSSTPLKEFKEYSPRTAEAGAAEFERNETADSSEDTALKRSSK